MNIGLCRACGGTDAILAAERRDDRMELAIRWDLTKSGDAAKVVSFTRICILATSKGKTIFPKWTAKMPDCCPKLAAAALSRVRKAATSQLATEKPELRWKAARGRSSEEEKEKCEEEEDKEEQEEEEEQEAKEEEKEEKEEKEEAKVEHEEKGEEIE
ncbi:unnamed protein product [Protopolystoma xenopodis]|uniref:Uncharacterized protein n=1 Tax=Protopolystoma xenopodis TaxID=117903 RepID=A0A448WP09_9PLAT|nr:unnamed protein product [Protopolystoma xenopodis]